METIHVTRAGGGEHWLVAGDVTTVKASGRHTSGSLLVDEDHVPKAFEVGAGDTVSVPSMAWHNFENVGDVPGRFVAVHSPAAMEGFLREIGRKIEDPANPPEPEGPPSDEETSRMMQVIGRYMEVPPGRIQRKARR